MSGIYIHIPFCRKACHYCDFHFSTSTKTYAGVVKNILWEIEHWSATWKEEVSTLYFGGGTPSMLKLDDLKEILDSIRRNYRISPDAEITLEANPEDIHEGNLQAWKKNGINRLSIGVQSFYDEELEWMNRNHRAEKSIDAIRLAQNLGFENITIDLIYGVPVSNWEKWKSNVQMALDLKVPHISAYALTVENKTALAHHVAKGTAEAPSESESHEQFIYLRSALKAAGFDAYEISNYGKPGWHSKHNTNYWKGVAYLGIGPGAHSFEGMTRRWNVSNNSTYIKSIEAGEPWYETEVLSVRDQFNEYIMTGLRRSEGILMAEIEDRFGSEYAEHLKREALTHKLAGRLIDESGRMQLSSEGLFFADGIASDLFWV